MAEIRKSNQHVDNPPPRAGRTFSDIPGLPENAWVSNGSAGVVGSTDRRHATERAANLTPSDGENTGNLFVHCPLCGVDLQSDRCTTCGWHIDPDLSD
jgi:hypothetical protein